jgi:methylglutaconyl-CoA hydratase
MPYTTLKLAVEGELAILTLSRPEKRNAISPAMVEELPAALEALESSPARVVILTGEGKAFCSGMDLDSLRKLAQQSPEQNLSESRRAAHMFRRIWSYPKPLIAAVNGAALAGGCGIATLCDFTLASSEATFGFTEVRIGFVPALISLFVTRQVGEKVARDLFLTGRVMSADEAQRLGLVLRVVPPERLMEAARELAGTLLEHSSGSLEVTKRLLVEPAEAALDRQIERAITESVAIRSTPDFREGLTAFLEKRKPRWSNSRGSFSRGSLPKKP